MGSTTIYTSEKFELRKIGTEILVKWKPENFEVRRCDFVYKFDTDKVSGHYLFNAFGIWDKLNNGFVSMDDFCKETGKPMPTTWSKKWKASKMIAAGLLEGYNIVPLSSLTTNKSKT